MITQDKINGVLRTWSKRSENGQNRMRFRNISADDEAVTLLRSNPRNKCLQGIRLKKVEMGIRQPGEMSHELLVDRCLGRKVETYGVDAVPNARWRWSIRKDVPQVCITRRAPNLRTYHPMARIENFFEMSAV